MYFVSKQSDQFIFQTLFTLNINNINITNNSFEKENNGAVETSSFFYFEIRQLVYCKIIAV